MPQDVLSSPLKQAQCLTQCTSLALSLNLVIAAWFWGLSCWRLLDSVGPPGRPRRNPPAGKQGNTSP